MFDDLLAANRRYAENFDLIGLPGHAAVEFALVTCIDTRIDPLAVLGLSVGDAKIIRTAGGRVSDDVLRSLVLATGLLGVTRIAVMHHTRCALEGRGDEQIRAMLPPEQAEAISDWPLGGMPDRDAALIYDVSSITNCRGIPEGLSVAGWRYDVDTGLVTEKVNTTTVHS